MADTASIVQKLVRISHGYPITILRRDEYPVAISILVFLNLMCKTAAIKHVVEYTGKFRRPEFIRDVSIKIIAGLNKRDEVAAMLFYDMINTLRSMDFSDVTITYGSRGFVTSMKFH